MGGMRTAGRVTLAVAGLAACIAIAAASPESVAARTNAVIFFDDMEHGTNGWIVTRSNIPPAACVSPPEWHLMQGDSHSPTHAWTNSPYSQAGAGGGNCLDHLNSPPIDVPADAATLTLTFWEHHYTEDCTNPRCDYGIVEISKDDGNTWTALPDPANPMAFQGGPNTWTQVTFSNISSSYFAAGTVVRIRYTFSSDALAASPAYLGWFIDDVELRANSAPTAVTVSSFKSTAKPRAVDLTWRSQWRSGVIGHDAWRSMGPQAVSVADR